MYNDRITCIAAFDKSAGIDRVWNFERFPAAKDRMTQEICAIMDNATEIAAFNGIRFDLPFMQVFLGLSDEQVGRWVMKCFDPFELFKSSADTTFGLNLLLQTNGIPTKTADGKQAIVFAKEGRWKELEEYCRMDTVLTWEICSQPKIIIPKIDSVLIAEPKKMAVSHIGT